MDTAPHRSRSPRSTVVTPLRRPLSSSPQYSPNNQQSQQRQSFLAQRRGPRSDVSSDYGPIVPPARPPVQRPSTQSEQKLTRISRNPRTSRLQAPPIEHPLTKHSHPAILEHVATRPIVISPTHPQNSTVSFKPSTRQTVDDEPFACHARYKNDFPHLQALAIEHHQDELQAQGEPGISLNILVIGAASAHNQSFTLQAIPRYPGHVSESQQKIFVVDGRSHAVTFYNKALNSFSLSEEEASQLHGAIALHDLRSPSAVAAVPPILHSLCESHIPILQVAMSSTSVNAAEKASLLVSGMTIFQISVASTDGAQRCISFLIQDIVHRLSSDHTSNNHNSSSAQVTDAAATSTVGLRRHRAASETSHASLKASASQDDLFWTQLTASTFPRQRRRSVSLSAAQRRLEAPKSDLSHHPTPKIPPSILATTSVRSSLQSGSLLSKITTNNFIDGESQTSVDSVSYQASTSSVDSHQPVQHALSAQELVYMLLGLTSNQRPGPNFFKTFFAFYWEFAAPSEVLEAVMQHCFSLFNRDRVDDKIPCLAQRDVAILGQWITMYPGDFAHKTMRQHLQTFLSIIGNSEPLDLASKHISMCLDVVVADDDTRWTRDIERARHRHGNRSISSVETITASGAYSFLNASQAAHAAEVDSKVILNVRSTKTLSAKGPSTFSMPLSLLSSARRQSVLLSPKATLAFGKIQWRTLLALSDGVVARELTRIDWTMFSAVGDRDLIRHVLVSPKNRRQYSALEHVTRMIDHFNHVAYWVTNVILLRDKPKHRAQALEKLMRIARKLRELNNYNALGAIVAGIQGIPVHRLTATKDLVSQAVQKDYMKLEILMSTHKGHFAYRLAWENTHTARIPFLPLHRRDLVSAGLGSRTFIQQEFSREDIHLRASHDDNDDDNSESDENGHDSENDDQEQSEEVRDGLEQASDDGDTTDEDEASQQPNQQDIKINWPKFEVMGQILQSVQRAQAIAYIGLVPNEEVKCLLLDCRIVKDDDQLYERSVALEKSAGTSTVVKKGLNWLAKYGMDLTN